MAAAAVGCGSTGDAGGPQITDFHFQEQMPGDPYTTIFAVTFTSEDGTLGSGSMNFYVDGKTSPLTLEMDKLFLSAGIAANATSGEVGPAIRFSSDVTLGSTVDLAVQLIDSKGRKSNRASVTLKFN